MIRLKRYVKNPIITPIPEHEWEAQSTFNPTAIYLDKRVHIIYRAMSKKDTSTLGYAISKDGVTIEKRFSNPIYVPRIEQEKKKKGEGFSGCEDPRITQVGDRLYMCYTAYDGVGPTRIGMTWIKVDDFLNQKWNWSSPKLISPPGIDDKNSCIIPDVKDGKYAIFHRIYPSIWVDFVDDLNFGENQWIKGSAWFKTRTDKWDNRKIGIAAPPIKTNVGWLLLYHGVSEADQYYRVGAMLLDKDNPSRVIARPDWFILEPRLQFELEGDFNNVVFPCGAVVIKDTLYVYYGGGDKVIGVAAVILEQLLDELVKNV